MSSPTDLLLDELAKIFGISRDEVSNRFSESELAELLGSSLCEPEDTSGILIDTVETACEDPAPTVLPEIPISNNSSDETINAQIEKSTNIVNCVNRISEINEIIKKQSDDYIANKVILDKLIEFRDHFNIIRIYFEERELEKSRIIGIFEPLLLQIAELSKTPILSFDSILAFDEISKIKSKIKEEEANFDIFREQDYLEIVRYLDDNRDSLTTPTASSEIRLKLLRLRNNYIHSYESRLAISLVSEYSNCLEFIIPSSIFNVSNISETFTSALFRFNLSFLDLDSLTNQREVYSYTDGSRRVETFQEPIKNSPLLLTNEFFDSSPNVIISQRDKLKDPPPSGKIYSEYYNLLADPSNNFFTLAERGLTADPTKIDPKVRGTASETKREGSSTFYVNDFTKLQEFYLAFEDLFELRKLQRKSNLTNSLDTLRASLRTIARKEMQIFLAIARVNEYLPSDSQFTESILTSIANQNSKVLSSSLALDNEILRLTELLQNIKPTPTKIKDLLKSESPECFSKIDTQISDCVSTKETLGIDPLASTTLTSGTDPTLPTFNQLCYWKEFSKILNSVGSSPIPNSFNPTTLRYWPVGLAFPSVTGITKVPLPILWIPLLTLPSPIGVFVIFLTVNGIFISPVVFFISSSGYKQHTLTIRGSSNTFGYSADSPLFKDDIISTYGAIAKIAKLNRENSIPESSNNRLETILNEREKSAIENNNNIQLSKIRRERNRNIKSPKSNDERFADNLDSTDHISKTINLTKTAIFNRISELGKPQTPSCSSLKQKITDRRTILLKKLQDQLSSGESDKASETRKLLKTDGSSLSEKKNAIKSDLIEYFDKIKFPKINIPKDSSMIDVKPNGIIDFINHITETSNVFRTQTHTPRENNVRSQFSIGLAKVKNSLDMSRVFNTETERSEITSFMLNLNSKVYDNVSGKSEIDPVDPSELTALSNDIENESSPVEKKKLSLKYRKLAAQRSSYLDNKRKSFEMSISEETVSALANVKVDYDPFSPCCNKEKTNLVLAPSPSIQTLSGAKDLIDSSINSNGLSAVLLNKKTVTSNDLCTSYLSIIRNSVPASLETERSPLNLSSLSKVFSGILASLFEIRVPIPQSAPSIQENVTLDLTILKSKMSSMFVKFIDDSLPDDFPEDSNNSQIAKDDNSSNDSNSYNILECQPNISNDSLLLGGSQSDIESPGVSSIIFNSSKDVLPSFQTISSDFLSINSSDLLAIVKGFVSLKVDELSSDLEAAHSILNGVKGMSGISLNIIEAAQHKILPFGQIAESAFSTKANLQKSLPKSSILKKLDTAKIIENLPKIEQNLSSIVNSQIPSVIVSGACAADSAIVKFSPPRYDTDSLKIVTSDNRPASSAIRELHPIINQDDIPPWERLSDRNPLFLLFIDDFISTGADQLGFFRSYL